MEVRFLLSRYAARWCNGNTRKKLENANLLTIFQAVAQLSRVLAREARGRRCESCQPDFNN